MAISESAGSATVEKDGNSAGLNVSGVNKDYFQSDKVTLLAGRSIKKADLDGNKHVIMVSDQIETFFTPYYMSNDNYEIATSTMESMTQSMSEMIQTVSLAISLIAGISLLVGGIGVMNIMLVSITERTREIGTRKALGATNGSIRIQFIIESMVLCLIGGCLCAGIFCNGTCGSDHCCGTVLHGRWRIFWILSGQQSSQTGSDRGTAIRIV